MQHFIARELVACAGSEHRIEDERHIGVVGQHLRHRGDVLDTPEHANLERVHGHVFEQAPRLIVDPIRIDRLHTFDTQGVLHGDGGDDRQWMAAHAGER